MQNADIARTFNQLADLLEIQGANAFRVRAYRSAAQTIEGLSAAVSDMIERGEDLTTLGGIGKDLAEKIETLHHSGSLPALDEAGKQVPAGLIELTRIDSLGPKRVKALYDELGVDSLDALKQAAREQRISALSGFGRKTERKILEEADRLHQQAGRTRLDEARQAAEGLRHHIEQCAGVEQVVVAGSYRRRRETVGDLDMLVVAEDGERVMAHVGEWQEIERVALRGETKTTVHLNSGLQVDVRVVPGESFGAALYYFTGSQAHNVAVRKMAVARDLKLNEYGVFESDEQLAGRTEEEVLAQVELPWIPPELRENCGEIEAAQAGKLPELVTRDDIRGDLHMHTTATDGKASLEEMAEAGRRQGYNYIAITDHSQRLAMANGLDAARLREQLADIDELNERLKRFTVLKSIEVDILEDGQLDLPDEVLGELDLCVASIHSRFNLDRERQTERLLRAMDNPHVSLIAHPTGRIVNGRDGYELDMQRIVDGAAERGVCLEINAQPARLDLRDIHARMAKEAGVLIAISTDAHATDQLDHMVFGVDQARRGWLEKDDVLNTRTLPQLRKALKR
ncbi:DNA polymerase (family 10) [Kushneria sinocarnis]|uniref:DNA polymerase beta n=1 Tax=Kushneria sinocarnis TaxID=595502 RepID=A0A420WVW8_9GAMM|nr:DNA polymerase/3'-5' exonuclease PolX [Kushneria sinocarnis]RKR03255.1 DNA polymerase (family 10) [Kushneria sinocarnis]